MMYIISISQILGEPLGRFASFLIIKIVPINTATRRTEVPRFIAIRILIQGSWLGAISTKLATARYGAATAKVITRRLL